MMSFPYRFNARNRSRAMATRAAFAAAVVMSTVGAPALGQPAAVEVRAIVAEVTLVIGAARVVGSDGGERLIDKGASVRIGEKIETSPGGHVHLRFVDGARVSVRPSSRLVVEDYSETVGMGGAIKFRLEQGVVRSITGQWGETSRDSFRLNTPLAAIGIKGTDFVARADVDRTVASVFTGAIVLAPMDVQCAASVGPCRNGREALLTQEMRGQVLQVDRGQVQPATVALIDMRPVGRGFAATSIASAVPVGQDPVNIPESETAGRNLAVTSTVRAGETLAVAANTPPRVDQLVWGRWVWARAIDGDIVANTIDAAFREGRDGLFTDGAHALFRPAAGLDARLVTQETSANFRLAGGSAHVIRNSGGVDTAKVTGGQLGVDFAHGTFSTRLDVTGVSIGSVGLSAVGSITPDGLMRSSSGNAFIAGGLSLDGREAGYFFDKPLDFGTLRGITLWGR